ncbi:hypothetical protein L9F63_003610 [Diploptera punctata]|uniref:BCD1 alpha/beta domain-containing protein n=1 Tax=Diploptera punctata TaxID=6984 RepID=A0AAD8E9W0_DIPPU|nr:hypothetical protein L9F63_003610 [Diploptera punctata]
MQNTLVQDVKLKTCSLSCVKIHKKELNCDGVRNKVAYKHLSNFTNLDLLSDYRLLQETANNVENITRDPSKQYTAKKELPINLYKLRAAASRRGTQLHFLPHNFTRSKENTTYFNWKEQLIYWRIEWMFPQAENMKCSGRRLLETEKLSKLVNVYLDPLQCESLYQDKLQYYQSAGLTGIILLMKAEMKSGTRYHQLDTSLTLKENLRGKTVIEFPTIFVILKDHKHIFDILSPDEEEGEEDASSYTNVNKNNLLFNTSDFSDSAEENEEETVKAKERKRKFNKSNISSYDKTRGPKRQYKKIDIPHYDVLVKQNS